MTDARTPEWHAWRAGGIGASGRVCSVDGCTSPSRRWGLCVLHSSRWARTRRVDVPPRYSPEFIEAVRAHYESGQTQAEVALTLGTTQKVVWRIMRTHGIPTRPAIPRDQTGPNGSAWRGDEASYASLHSRVEVARGKPQHCEKCGLIDPAARYEWANLSGRYTDVDDFARLCVPCHRRFDAERRRQTGQPTGMPK